MSVDTMRPLSEPASASTAGAAPANALDVTTDQYIQLAHQLTDGYWEHQGNTRHFFNISAGGTLSVEISALTAEGQQLARWALEAWTAVTGINFTFGGGASAKITFDDNKSGAVTNSSWGGDGFLTSASVNVSTAWIAQYGTTHDSYSLQTYIHEIGHALGLGHAGNYDGDATWGTDNIFAFDSWQASVMSYFSQDDNTNIDATYAYLQTPMVADIIAIRTLYGTTDINSGDTTYSFQSDFAGHAVARTIVDTGGTDTLDVSWSSAIQTIDLREAHYSDIGGLIGNLGISIGSVIENAKGGSAADTIIGNDAANTLNGGGGADHLTGGGGDDILNGGGGTDVAIFAGAFANFRITQNGDGSYKVQDLVGALGTDTVSNIGSLQFNDRLYSFSGAPKLNGAIADQTANAGSPFTLDVPAGLFTDPDNDPLTYTAELAGGGALPDWLKFNAGTMKFSGTPAEGNIGTVSVSLIASDGGLSAVDTFDLVVQLANGAPTAVDDAATMLENDIALINVTKNDSDPDGDTFSISSIISHTDNATISIVDGKIQVDYTGPDIAFGATGEVDVVYQIQDSKGQTDTATLAVTVTDSDGAPNTPPVASDDVANLKAGVLTALVDVTANDSDPDNDSFSVTKIVSVSGTADATIESGEIRVNYTGPVLGTGATDTVSLVYEITDKNGGTDTATLKVNLTGGEQRGPDIIGGPRHDELQGTELGEYIAGRKGADDIFGNGGDDIIDSGRGSDDLNGNAGADIFIFGAKGGHDNIYDFSHDEGDKVDLSGIAGITGYKDLIRHHISFDRFLGVLISVNHGNDLWVEDMDGRHMHRSDFIF